MSIQAIKHINSICKVWKNPISTPMVVVYAAAYTVYTKVIVDVNNDTSRENKT